MWDITWLKGPVKGMFYYLYLVVDLYSRKVVAHEVYEVEKGAYASKLIQKAVDLQPTFAPRSSFGTGNCGKRVPAAANHPILQHKFRKKWFVTRDLERSSFISKTGRYRLRDEKKPYTPPTAKYKKHPSQSEPGAFVVYDHSPFEFFLAWLF